MKADKSVKAIVMSIALVCAMPAVAQWTYHPGDGGELRPDLKFAWVKGPTYARNNVQTRMYYYCEKNTAVWGGLTTDDVGIQVYPKQLISAADPIGGRPAGNYPTMLLKLGDQPAEWWSFEADYYDDDLVLHSPFVSLFGVNVADEFAEHDRVVMELPFEGAFMEAKFSLKGMPEWVALARKHCGIDGGGKSQQGGPKKSVYDQ